MRRAEISLATQISHEKIGLAEFFTQEKGARRHDTTVLMWQRPSNGKACYDTPLHDGPGVLETEPCSKLSNLQTNSRHTKFSTACYRMADEARAANAVLPGLRDVVRKWLTQRSIAVVMSTVVFSSLFILPTWAVRGPAGATHAVMLLPFW